MVRVLAGVSQMVGVQTGANRAALFDRVMVVRDPQFRSVDFDSSWHGVAG
jgi:hypothetical protein